MATHEYAARGPDDLPKPTHVLLFFSVGSQAQTKTLVQRNVDRFRTTKGLSADVYLAHYAHDRNDWLQQMGPWYKQNVNFSMDLSGLKFWLARDLLLPSQQDAQAELLPKVDILKYDYLWILDEDAHFGRTNLAKVFGLAQASQASIMTPAFTTVAGSNATVHMLKRRRGSAQSDSACQRTDAHCFFQAPDPNCTFRYTDFVECSFAIMRPEIFQKIIGECRSCLPNRTSTWGLDDVWCNYAAEIEHRSPNKTCAILDAAPIIHANTKSHPKYNLGEACGTDCNQQTMNAVQKTMKKYWTWPASVRSCERRA